MGVVDGPCSKVPSAPLGRVVVGGLGPKVPHGSTLGYHRTCRWHGGLPMMPGSEA